MTIPVLASRALAYAQTGLPGFSWQQAGALIQNVGNLGGDKLPKLAAAGGKWIAPLLYNDGSAADNLARLPALIQQAARVGIRTGGWFNGAAGDQTQIAADVAAIAKTNGLAPVILDLEFPYKAGTGDADLMPELLVALRQQFPVGTRAIGVTSFGFCDRGMIWGGQARFPSFRDLAVRFLPQWYFNDPSVYPDHDARYAPDWCMADLDANGATDLNLQDLGWPDHRGLPDSYVHGLLEPTGVEGASLADGLARARLAKQHGFTKGFSLYLLERVPDSDFTLVQQATDLRV